VRGQRVELGEVEAAVSALPEVAESAVVLRTDTTGNTFLAAFVVPRAPGVTATKLAAERSPHLPGHLIPAAWSLVERFPRTPSAKIDRGWLENVLRGRRSFSALHAPAHHRLGSASGSISA
jgi:acyl-coenzyme A synthetase/AMP-(fatty) acid ligase